MSEVTYKKEFFECMCHRNDHTIEVSFWDYGDGELPEILLHVFLCDRPGLLGRIRRAFQYIIGKRTIYGHFGEWTLDINDADRFMHFLKEYKKSFKKWQEAKMKRTSDHR